MNNIQQIINEAMENTLTKARKDVDRNPTDGQKEAGNYRKGHVKILGFQITIENPKGSYRNGKDRDGKEWKTLMHNDYGYFVRTLGKDGDAIDVFIGPNLKSQKIFPVDQFVNGEFDETKVMLGFDSKEEAKAAYLSNYEKDWKGFKYITEVDIDTFKKWLYDGYRQRKPFAKYVSLTESKKQRKNDEGEVVPEKCECGGDVALQIHGEPVYVCKKCGKYFGTMPKKLNEDIINESHYSEYYHFLGINELYRVLKDGVFKFAGNKDNPSTNQNYAPLENQFRGGQNGYISLTRMRSIEQGYQYFMSDGKQVIARITFDGLALNNLRDVQIRPLDFIYNWNEKMPSQYYQNETPMSKTVKTNQGQEDPDAEFGQGKHGRSLYTNGEYNQKWASKLSKFSGGSGDKFQKQVQRQFQNQAEESLVFNNPKGVIPFDELKRVVKRIDILILQSNITPDYLIDNYHLDDSQLSGRIYIYYPNARGYFNLGKNQGCINVAAYADDKYWSNYAGNQGNYQWVAEGKNRIKINEDMINEKFNSPLLAKYAKEHKGLKVDRNGGLRSGVMAYQNGNKIDPAEVTDEMIYGTPFKFDWNSDNEYRETQFNNSIHFADGYAVLLRPHYSWDQDSVKISEPRKKANRYDSGIGDTGDHDKSRGGFVGNGKDALSAPYNGFSVSDRAGEGQMRREAWNNNLRDIKYWEKAIKKLEAEIENEPDSRRIPALQYEIRSIKSKIANARENIDDIKSYSKELLKNKVDKVVAEAIKRNPPKDVAAAVAKGNREADIELHGKPTAFRSTKMKSPKDYTRKIKHKEKIDESQLRQIIREAISIYMKQQ